MRLLWPYWNADSHHFYFILFILDSYLYSTTNTHSIKQHNDLVFILHSFSFAINNFSKSHLMFTFNIFWTLLQKYSRRTPQNVWGFVLFPFERIRIAYWQIPWANLSDQMIFHQVQTFGLAFIYLSVSLTSKPSVIHLHHHMLWILGPCSKIYISASHYWEWQSEKQPHPLSQLFTKGLGMSLQDTKPEEEKPPALQKCEPLWKWA